MKKALKRITALALAAVTTGAISAVAYAATDGASRYNFNIYGYGQSRYSDPSTKDDTRDFAAVTYEEGIISETHFMYITVCSYSGGYGSPITDTIQVTALGASALKYKSIPAIGDECCLKGQIGYYDAKLSGAWIP